MSREQQSLIDLHDDVLTSLENRIIESSSAVTTDIWLMMSVHVLVGSQEEASGSLSQQGHRPRQSTEAAAIATAVGGLTSSAELAEQAGGTAAGAGPLFSRHSLPGKDAQEAELPPARGRVTAGGQEEDRIPEQQQHTGMLGDLPDKPGHLATVEQCRLANGGVCWHLLQMAVRARQFVQKSNDAEVRSKLSCRPCSLHEFHSQIGSKA